MVPCPNCGHSVPDHAQHCPYCGESLVRKKVPGAPFYLIGVILLASSGVLLGRQLQSQSLDGVTSTPVRTVIAATQMTQSPTREPVSPTATRAATATQAGQRTVLPSQIPIGKIVFTCQVSRDPERNQICIMNADGSDQRRLTADDRSNHFYPSLAPDGRDVVFSSNQAGAHEIYEMDLYGRQTRLTFLGEVYAPEISPDGNHIVFNKLERTYSSIWVMDRDGGNPHLVYGREGFEAVDPTWSPDGKGILFAHGKGDNKKLYTVALNGSDLQIVNDDFITRGRSDWSPDGNKIAGYTGGRWQRAIYLMNFDGSGLLELFGSGNVQAPSFSPDGGWIGFTGYIDNIGNDNGCEIYIMRLADGELQRLTDNDYCDWQPRWGP